ncbi:MAG: type II toxin-antitoxin system HicB family antitoxin [Myxococcaceae bacterium]|nr:type II toxin-antitoxin system HicB family antitoxin [Myxococcaceae bacterium]
MSWTFLHADTGLVVLVEDADERGWFVADVPLLPGCVSQGRTLEDAKVNILGAIEDVLEVLRQDDPERYSTLTSPGEGSRPGV